MDEELFNKLLFGIQAHAEECMEKASPLLGRDEKDLSPIEHTVLLVACHELNTMPETLYPIIINEAIEVTKTFGGIGGYKFVSGILGQLAPRIHLDEPRRKG